MKKSVISGAAIVASGLAATQGQAAVTPTDNTGESVVIAGAPSFSSSPTGATGSGFELPSAQTNPKGRLFAQTIYGGDPCRVLKKRGIPQQNQPPANPTAVPRIQGPQSGQPRIQKPGINRPKRSTTAPRGINRKR